MQRVEGPSSRLAPEPTRARPSLSPPFAFLLLVVVIGILGTIFYLTKPDAPATPTNADAVQQQPDFSLTNEEAITRFEELDRIRIAMYATRDLSLLDSFLVSDSPLKRKATREVTGLLRDGVVPITDFVSESITVISNGPGTIVVRQVETDRSRFETESGKDITQGPRVIQRTVDWTLRLEHGVWLLFDSDQVGSRVVKK